MRRVLIIPAAGRGSRLQSDLPKVLYPIAGRPMLDHLLDLYSNVVDGFIIVASPEGEPLVRRHCAGRKRISYAVQARPDGMLPAILEAAPAAAQSDARSVWITWCDQVAVRPGTIHRLAALSSSEPPPDLVFPTVRKDDPYIHFDRDESGRITTVRHRREGDTMPEIGEGDSGLFALSAEAYFDRLPAFARQSGNGAATGERNFLPFIPWLAAKARVVTYAVEDEIEAMGVNTRSDAETVEKYLAATT